MDCSEHVSRYGYLARKTARMWARQLSGGLEIGDLESAGYIGLTAAARAYRDGTGASFKTYAIAKIRGAVREELRKWDYWPRSARDKERSGGPACPAVLSMEQACPTSPNLRVVDSLVDEGPQAFDEARRAERAAAVRQAVAKLPDRECEVVCRYYGGDETFLTIAGALGISESRAYQLHGQAIKRLREDADLRAVVLA